MVDLSTNSFEVAALVVGVVLMILAFQYGILSSAFGYLGFFLISILVAAYVLGKARDRND